MLLLTSYWVAILGAFNPLVFPSYHSSMVKKKMTKTILTILIVIQIIVGTHLQSTWDYWLFTYNFLQSPIAPAVVATFNLQWLRWGHY